MARLVIVLEVDDVDPTLVDPHEVAADVLHEEVEVAHLAPFDLVAGRGPAEDRAGTFVSAEWSP